MALHVALYAAVYAWPWTWSTAYCKWRWCCPSPPCCNTTASAARPPPEHRHEVAILPLYPARLFSSATSSGAPEKFPVTHPSLVRYRDKGGEATWTTTSSTRCTGATTPPALLYAQGLCRSRHLAKDLVQEAFCRAWLFAAGRCPQLSRLAVRVLRNLLIDHQRRQKHLSADDPRRSRPTTPPRESVLLHREDAAALCRALERLPDADRELLTLHCFARPDGGGLADTLHMTPYRGAPAAIVPGRHGCGRIWRRMAMDF